MTTTAKGFAYGLEGYTLGIKDVGLFNALSNYVNDPATHSLIALLAKLGIYSKHRTATQNLLTLEDYNNICYLGNNKNYDHVFWVLMALIPDAKDLIYNLKTSIDSDKLFDFILDYTDSDHVKQQLLNIKNFDSSLDYLKLLEKFDVINSAFVYDLIKAIEAHPSVNWKDAISRFQLGSKNWIATEIGKLNVDLGNVALMGGWVGTQARILYDAQIHCDSITSYDLDVDANSAAMIVNARHNTFKSVMEDIYNVDYSNYNTVINAICEHIPDFNSWYSRINPGTLVILQNNNMTEAPDHINCVHSLEEFSKQVSLSTKLYEGEYQFMNWTRYMIIGYK
jgi:hypothetical protein